MSLLVIHRRLKQHTFALKPEELILLKNEAPDFLVRYVNYEETTEEQLKEAEVIFGWPDVKRLHLAKKLKWLHAPSAGVEAYADLRLYANPEIIITRAAGIFGSQIAEHVMMLFLALSRGMIECVQSTVEGEWIDLAPKRELSGSTVLIVGTGSIGSELAKHLQGFNCRIIGIKRDVSVPPPYFDEIYRDSELDEHLPRADYVSLCLPFTSDTEAMFDYRRFKLMKSTGIIANVGRGNSIVTNDLNRALREGLIAGAGLDVTEPEPLPKEHPLWSAPNIIITPHISGLCTDLNRRRFDMFFDLWKRYTKGLPLCNVFDFSKGY